MISAVGLIEKDKSEPLINFFLGICFVSWGCPFMFGTTNLLVFVLFENIPFLCYIM